MYFIGIFKFVVYNISMCIKQFWDIVGTISCSKGKIVTKCNIFNNQQVNMMNITLILATNRYYYNSYDCAIHLGVLLAKILIFTK